MSSVRRLYRTTIQGIPASAPERPTQNHIGTCHKKFSDRSNPRNTFANGDLSTGLKGIPEGAGGFDPMYKLCRDQPNGAGTLYASS